MPEHFLADGADQVRTDRCHVAIGLRVDVGDDRKARQRNRRAFHERREPRPRGCHELAVPSARDVERYDAFCAGGERKFSRSRDGGRVAADHNLSGGVEVG